MLSQEERLRVREADIFHYLPSFVWSWKTQIIVVTTTVANGIFRKGFVVSVAYILYAVYVYVALVP